MFLDKGDQEPIPKNKNFLTYLWLPLIDKTIDLLYNQYLINKYEVINIAGLNIKYVGKTLAVLLIEAPPSM